MVLAISKCVLPKLLYILRERNLCPFYSSIFRIPEFFYPRRFLSDGKCLHILLVKLSKVELTNNISLLSAFSRRKYGENTELSRSYIGHVRVFLFGSVSFIFYICNLIQRYDNDINN